MESEKEEKEEEEEEEGRGSRRAAAIIAGEGRKEKNSQLQYERVPGKQPNSTLRN